MCERTSLARPIHCPRVSMSDPKLRRTSLSIAREKGPIFQTHPEKSDLVLVFSNSNMPEIFGKVVLTRAILMDDAVCHFSRLPWRNRHCTCYKDRPANGSVPGVSSNESIRCFTHGSVPGCAYEMVISAQGYVSGVVSGFDTLQSGSCHVMRY